MNDSKDSPKRGDGRVRFWIEADLPDEQASAFLEALNGKDSDVILLAERAIRERLDHVWDDEIELRLDEDTRLLLAEAASRND